MCQMRRLVQIQRNAGPELKLCPDRFKELREMPEDLNVIMR